MRQKERKRAAYDDQMERYPKMSWSSTKVMEDALDGHFGYPEGDLLRLGEVMPLLGPKGLRILETLADDPRFGPAAKYLLQ